MDDYIRISNLNDFIFCPKSIYFHDLYSSTNERVYKDTPQVAGTIAHTTIDTKTYTTAASVLQWIPIYSERYKLAGKIDSFDSKTGILTERKKLIKQIYQGYIYQLYAQYFCLTEMGYTVTALRFYSMEDNTVYPIDLPTREHITLFEEFLATMRHFDPLDSTFSQNPTKCAHCIYRELCDTYKGE